jgi:hypothetical protein
VITPAIHVAVLDPSGNLVSNATNRITILIAVSPGPATLSGTQTVAAVNGIATFSDLSIDKAGAGYALAAGASELTGATSASFDVTSTGAASRLVFVVQPTNAVSRASITPAVQVSAEDASGTTVPSFTGAVTVAIGTNPSGGTLSGTTTIAATNGVALFSTLSIDKAGTGYTLTAIATGLTTATSAGFDVTPAAPTMLVFTAQPSNVMAGAQITPAVQVTARDGSGNTTTSFTGTVTVAIGTNPGGGTLSGTKTVAATNGVATFSGLSIDKAGAGYTLRGSAAGLIDATSSAFNVTASAATPVWTQLSPSGGPPDADGGPGAVAIDAANNRLMVFAGIGASGNTNATWVLTNADGQGGTPTWTPVTANGAVGSPPPRHGASAVYDPTNNRLIIFGGCLGGCLPVSSDVWVLSNANGLGGAATWTQLSPSGTPPAGRQAQAAVYDGTNNRLIIWGGQDGGGSGGSTYAELWVLTNANGLGGASAWTKLSPTGGPPPGQYGPSGAYDPVNNRLVVFGGGAQGSGQATNATWVLSNANGLGGPPAWTNVVAEGAAGSPPPSGSTLAGYDASANRMVVVRPSADVWVLANANGLGGASTWTQLSPTGSPPAVAGAGALRTSSLRFTTIGSAASNAAAWVLTHATGQ